MSEENNKCSCKECKGEFYQYECITTSHYIDGKWEDVYSLCHTCDKKIRLNEWQSNKIITSRLMLDAEMERYFMESGNPDRSNNEQYLPICEALDKLNQKVYEFENKVWHPLMRPAIKEAKYNSLSCKILNVNILTTASAGRRLITMQEHDAQITLIIVEDALESYQDTWPDKKNFMGIQSICATEAQASDILDFVVRHSEEIDLKDNTNLTIC